MVQEDCRCECICQGPGHCPRYRREMSEEDFRVCRGETSTPEFCDHQRSTWAAAAQELLSRNRPGLIRKAVNFGKAVVEDVAAGSPRVSDELYAARLAICLNCPSCFKKRMICQEKSCGCRLRIKARWALQKCPLGIWPALAADASAQG